MADIANRDEGLRCLEIARSALKAGDPARAEKFAAKALKLYRCPQTESMVLQVQVFISELTPQGREPSSSSRGASSAAGPHANGTHHHQQQHGRGHQQQQQQQQQHGSADHSHQQRRQQQQQQQQGQPRGMGTSDGLRHRHGRQQQQPPQQEDPSVTPEQRQVVQQILAAESFYDVLGVARGAGDTEIKAAYRKLALRLHPDKNRALKADEAFKLLSRAFSCLSNPDKRAYYDRTGFESSAAAAAAAPARRGSGRAAGQQFYYSGPDDFDPEEIFNMFFGAGAFNPGAARMFRAQFGGAGPAQRAAPGRPPSREEQQRTALMGLLQLLPVLLLICVTLFSGSSEPTYSLAADGAYRQPQVTGRLGVTFYVKDLGEFTKNFPAGSHKRHTLERQVESDAYERLYQRCQNERMAQHRAYTWGNREAARKMELTSCQELGRLNEKASRTPVAASGRQPM